MDDGGAGLRGERSPRASAFVGAYAVLSDATLEQEADLYRTLAGRFDVRGLELPWTGSLHRAGTEWLRDNLPDSWEVMVTSIPQTMGMLHADSTFGLGSTESDGRMDAITDARRLSEAIDALNQTCGRRVVVAVELHGAPRAVRGAASAACLADSLTQLAGLDWGGADLLLEHCDALIRGHAPAKGFLSLDNEIEAVAGLPVGIVINWGRSAIELRDPDRVVDHISRARAAGVLRGLIFSGVSAQPNDYGAAWADQHLPFQSDGGRLGHDRSLLTTSRAQECLDAAGQIPTVGVKVAWRNPTPSVDQWARLLGEWAEFVGAPHQASLMHLREETK